MTYGIRSKYLRLEWFPTWRTHSGYDADPFVFFVGRWFVAIWLGALAVEFGHRP